MNIAILNLQDFKELSYTIDCLQFIDNEIIDAQIDIFTNSKVSEELDTTYIRHIFPIHLENLILTDLSTKYSQIRVYSRLYKYHIAVDTDCTFKSAITTYLLSGRTAGFKKSGFLGYLKSKLYDETIPYDETKDKKELTYMLLAKTFGFEKKEDTLTSQEG